MAIPNSPDCSLAFIINYGKTTNKKTTFKSTSKSSCYYSSLRGRTLLRRVSLAKSAAGCPCPSPPLLEDDDASSAEQPILLELDPNDQLVIQHFTQSDSDDLNSFICTLFEDPQTEEEVAYKYYERAKQKPGFRPQKKTLKHVIRYLIHSKNWSSIWSLCEDFRISTTSNVLLLPDSNSCHRLVSCCIRARKFKLAHTLLDAFKTDKEIASVAFDSAMKGYNKLHMYSSTVALHGLMKSAGILLPDPGCYSRVMEAYMKIGDSESVVRLFEEFWSTRFGSLALSSSSTRQICRILCESLGKSGRPFEALEYFREMTKEEEGSAIFEHHSIYSSLICSFASIGEVNAAEELFTEAERKKIMLRDPAVFLKLVLMYVEERQPEKTTEVVVPAMKRAGIRVSDCIFCAVVNGFSKRRGLRAAAKVYEDLVFDGCEPGQVTYASIINVYCRLGLYGKAEKVFSEMENKGFDRCTVAYSNMVAMYGKTGKLRNAMRLVAKMKERGIEPNVWIYNSLLDMHGKACNLRQVDKIWKEMKRRKILPDKVSYTSVISAYSKAREFEMCVKYYEEFRINGGGIIDRAMGGIMVGVFSKMSRVDQLVKLLQDMKTQGTRLDGRLHRSALNAFRDAGFPDETATKMVAAEIFNSN